MSTTTSGSTLTEPHIRLALAYAEFSEEVDAAIAENERPSRSSSGSIRRSTRSTPASNSP